jgi:drug/metabolite transporter (DMT)-like permease
MAAVLALAGALGWGIGDFLGGLAARRLAVLTVLAISQAVGLAGVLVWALLSGDAFPGVAPLLPAAAAGLAAMVGLAALYRGLAVGTMGIVAPISAAAPVVPLTVDAARGDVPSAVQWLGVVLVVCGIVVVSREPGGDDGRRPIAAGAGLAVVAAVAFGIFFVGIDAGSDESTAWAVTAARSASVPVAVTAALLTSATLRPPRRLLPMLVGVGLFDTGANVLIAAATTYGAVGIVAVLGSLYPVVTMVLAWLVLGERLGPAKRVGGGVALVGAAFVAGG